MTSVLRLGVVLVALTSAACAAAPRQRNVEGGAVDTGPGTVAAARKYLEGRWSLVSYQVFPAGQPPIKLTGSGTLSYDSFGNLDIEIRVEPAIAELLDGAGIPSKQGVISTNGRAAVDMQAHTLTYVLEGQPAFVKPSGPLALNLPRHWEVNGNILTLTTKGDDGRTMSEGRWQKVP